MPTKVIRTFKKENERADPMARLVHYHHPCADNYSLRYCSTSPAELQKRQQEVTSDTKLVGYPFEPPVYVLYEATNEPTAVRNLEIGREWLEERLSSLSQATRVTHLPTH